MQRQCETGMTAAKRLLVMLAALAACASFALGGEPPRLASPGFLVRVVHGRFLVVPAPASPAATQNAAQLLNAIFDSTNTALKVHAVATGGGGGPSAYNYNEDQILNAVFDSTNTALKVNCVVGCGGGGGSSIGGTVTGGTQGSVLFLGAASVLAQDNANFFWDGTNHRLGIATNTFNSFVASNGLQVAGNLYANNLFAANLSGGYAAVSNSNGQLVSDATAGGQFFWDLTNHCLAIGAASCGSTAGVANFLTGLRVNNAAPAGHYPRGNGTNYVDSGSPCASSTGACGSAPAGAVSIAAGATTVTVATTSVTANSQIFVQEDSSLGGALSVTCNTSIVRTYQVTARTAGTSFVVTASAAPVTNPACLSYFMVN